MLNDCEISPTNYMIAFLRQRGWHLPEVTMRIPNVIPEVDPIAARVPPSLRIMLHGSLHACKQDCALRLGHMTITLAKRQG